MMSFSIRHSHHQPCMVFIHDLPHDQKHLIPKFTAQTSHPTTRVTQNSNVNMYLKPPLNSSRRHTLPAPLILNRLGELAWCLIILPQLINVNSVIRPRSHRRLLDRKHYNPRPCRFHARHRPPCWTVNDTQLIITITRTVANCGELVRPLPRKLEHFPSTHITTVVNLKELLPGLTNLPR